MLTDWSKIKVAIVYRSTADSRSSHQGLGICAINTCKTLTQHGIKCVVWPVTNQIQIQSKLLQDKAITHIVIQAPWVESPYLSFLAFEYPDVQFAVNCHSNVGFLQTEP